MIKRGDTQGWEATYILKNMSQIKESRNQVAFINLLAFVIYALILFLGAYGMMYLKVADVFLAVLHR